MSHSCPACLQVGWNDVPLPVLTQIFQVMTAKEMWAVRAVGTHWACAVRATIESTFTIQATDKNLKAKMSAIYRYRCQTHYPLARFVLQLKKSSTLHSAAKLLLSVTKLVSRFLLLWFSLPEPCSCVHVCNLQLECCNLVGGRMNVCMLQGDRLPIIQLVLPVHSPEADANTPKDASFIAIACTWLQDRGVQVCLELSSTAKAKSVPAPAVIKQLAPFFSSVDYHPMPTADERESYTFWMGNYTDNSQLCLTESHVSALASGGQSLQTLCISDVVQPHWVLFTAQIPSIAALSNLTKLHLNLRGQPDFSPLAQLNKLEDLALYCPGFSSDCSQVIDSNRFSLQRLTVGSESWSDATYAAIFNAASLEDIVLLAYILSPANAALVGNLTHPSSVTIRLLMCSLTAFQILRA